MKVRNLQFLFNYWARDRIQDSVAKLSLHQFREAIRGYLSKLTDQDLNHGVQYQTTRGQPNDNILWHLLNHIVNHRTEHRSVLAAELTEYGFFLGDRGYRFDPFFSLEYG